ncbi:hypothetical protein [Bdellovibrio sp. NC01]|uniref:hypothetical protein n=1 Tax=Bdellovibrio sp. NC01 TaxID=2220073 RepID=UPI00115ADC6F|nr:hypothetical protein [Bdellovibrio sp. NC01]QDK36378.1 hypothetical protein DOE51_01560 [Bdellovibrio sp. NC01]
MTGGNHYKVNITFNSGGNYNSSIEWYTGGSCSGLPITVVYGTSGTYNVGNTISGSAKQISFVVNSSYVMAGSVTVQSAFNSDCGGTSPYSSGTSTGANGVAKSSYMMSCLNMDFPNSGNKNVENIATYDGTVLTIGAPDPGLPGAFNTPPGSATLQLY